MLATCASETAVATSSAEKSALSPCKFTCGAAFNMGCNLIQVIPLGEAAETY